MRIAVIATVLNERVEIAALVESLRVQTLPPAEVVIVDGGSVDGTWEALLAEAASFPALRPVRDESCSRKFSAGPIARGRNVAIRAADAEVVACVDAGCRYAPEWLHHLAAPLRDGTAEYALGGSMLDVKVASLADLAAAPFLGVKLDPAAPTKSCTARSMAFTRAAWERAGGFPETLFIGEDVLFDQRMRSAARTAFVRDAKAIYTPGNSFREALRQVSSYAVADGVAGMRPARLVRNVLRCVTMLVATVLAAVAVKRAKLPPYERSVFHSLLFPFVFIGIVAALEIYFALRLDLRSMLRIPVLRRRLAALLPVRLLFSLLVPWVVSSHQLLGIARGEYRVNRQNR